MVLSHLEGKKSIWTLIDRRPATTIPCSGSSLSSKWPDDFSSRSYITWVVVEIYYYERKSNTHNENHTRNNNNQFYQTKPYFIVDFQIWASHFKLIWALVTLDHIKNGIQAENHQSRITSCSNHCICFATKRNASLSQITKRGHTASL